MFKIVKNLEFDSPKTIYEEDGVKIFILRPSKLPARFKNYDSKKNFQLWLDDGHRKFIPNHLRVFLDLNLRTRCRPDLKKKLLLAFDNIFYGKDPEKELRGLDKENFEHFLNPLMIIGYSAQIFIIEQELAYHKESHFEPLTLFFQGWVREFLDDPKEIDNLCMSVCNRQTPLAKYTYKENKKNKKFEPNLKPLWYLGES